MISFPTTDLRSYLELNCGYQIVTMIDIDHLVQQPRKMLYEILKQSHKPAFENQERIVMYSRHPVTVEVLEHIQKVSSLIDISNFFILICAKDVNKKDLEAVRNSYSTDNTVFSSLQIEFTDTIESLTIDSTLFLPDTFCFNPWAHMEISPNGEFRPCCVYKEPIKDVDGRIYNINVDRLENVYQSDYMSNLRKQFLSGEKPLGCSNCWIKEQYNGKSNRNWATTLLGLDAQLLDLEKNSVENLISLDIKLGNLCNFNCRICGPGSSSKIAAERVRYFDLQIDLKLLNQQGQWTENTKIWNSLESIGHQLVNIDFYGGEPFLIKQHEIFLNYLIQHNHASKIRLHYNSNGSIYPTHLFDKWSYFKEVDIAFSIDNVGNRFELERGGTWEEVNENLDNFIKFKLPNMILSIFATVNIQNIYYLDQLIDWYETKKFNMLTFQLLETPHFLNITAMNKELSDLVINKLTQIDQQKLTRYNLVSFIELIKNSKNSPDKVDKLAEYMLKLDKIRKQNFEQTHSEIAHIIYKGNNHGKTI